MSNKEKLDKVRKQILSKSFSNKSQAEKEILLETYVESVVKVKEIESKQLELEMQAQDKEREERQRKFEIADKENERKHKRFTISAVITAISIVLEVIVLVLFLSHPSELGVKALDLGLVAISGLITVLFGVKKEKND